MVSFPASSLPPHWKPPTKIVRSLKKGAIALSRWGGDFGADIRMVASHYRELCGISKKRDIVFRKAAPTQNCICCTKFYFVYNHYIHKSVCTIMVTYVFDHGYLELCLVAVFLIYDKTKALQKPESICLDILRGVLTRLQPTIYTKSWLLCRISTSYQIMSLRHPSCHSCQGVPLPSY
jgi:hypothetical protein